MKSMTCKQLGGACDLTFEAASFQEMAKLSQAHGKEMFMKGDSAHLEAMKKIQEIAKDPKAMADWMKAKEAEFDALPEKA